MKTDDRHMNEELMRVNQLIFNKVTEGQFGWFAGIVDGECYFIIAVTWKSDGRVDKFNPRLGVANTNPLIFRKMHAMGLEAIVRPRKRIEKEDGSGLRRQAYIAILYVEDLRARALIVMLKIL